MAALIAQRMFKIKRIVARIYDPPRGQMYRELGVQTVCPTTVGAKIIRDVLIEAPWDSLKRSISASSRRSRAVVGAADAGKRVAEIEEAGRVRIAAVRRGVARSDWSRRTIWCLKKATSSTPSLHPTPSATLRNASRASTPRPKVTA